MDQVQLHRFKATFSQTDNAYEKIGRLYNFATAPEKFKILDVGCGSGLMDEVLRGFGHQVIGLDIFTDNLLKYPDFMECDINQTWPVGAQTFDYVICLDTAEHLYDPEHILREARRVLKPQGRLILGVPNAFDLRQRFRMLFGKGIVHWVDPNYAESAADYAHIRFFDVKSFLKILKRNNWHLEVMQFNFQAGGIIPTTFTPSFFRAWLLKLRPGLFSGKFIAGVTISPIRNPKFIYLAKTPKGL